MGRRYIYNKKRRVRKTQNNTVVLELENEKNLSPSLLTETYKKKKSKGHKYTVNLDSDLILPSSSNIVQPDLYNGLNKKPSSDNKLLVNLEQPMTMNVKRKNMILECTNKAEKQLCKSESSGSIATGVQKEILNKKILNQVKIEPFNKRSNFTQSRTLQQTVASNEINKMAIKNTPTFILVSKTSMDDIGKKPINLSSNVSLKQISFKTLETKLLKPQKKNVTVQHRPILPKLASYSVPNSIEYLQFPVSVQHESILDRFTYTSTSNPIICMEKPNNESKSYECLETPDQESQASANFEHESILHRLTSASSSNPIICMKKSDISFYGTTLVQNNVNITQENISHNNIINISNEGSEVLNIFNEDSEILNTSNEDTKSVYPVALKANNTEDYGTIEIFSNDLDNEEEMQILGI